MQARTVEEKKKKAMARRDEGRCIVWAFLLFLSVRLSIRIVRCDDRFHKRAVLVLDWVE